jgi:hypothetical protein
MTSSAGSTDFMSGRTSGRSDVILPTARSSRQALTSSTLGVMLSGSVAVDAYPTLEPLPSQAAEVPSVPGRASRDRRNPRSRSSLSSERVVADDGRRSSTLDVDRHRRGTGVSQ